MKILAIDTVIDTASVAISIDEEIVYYRRDDKKHKQAENLIYMIEAALFETNVQYKELSYIAVCIGPGSFTGTRIGVSAANGFFSALNIKLIGVTSLETIAIQNSKLKKSLIVLNAGRNQCYTQFYKNGLPISSIEIMENSKIIDLSKRYYVIGNSNASNQIILPNAKLVLKAAFYRLKQKLIKKTVLKPLYIRLPDAITLSN